MTRRVAYGKAILAGALGALLFALADWILYELNLPVFNMVRALGTLFFPHASAWYWFPAGLAVNVFVGAIWAIFYSYFFWSVFPWRPALQGLAFAAIPFLLAGLIMVPQLSAMNPVLRWEHDGHIGMFARHLGWWGPLGLVITHALYGLVLGAIYTHPVGYPVTYSRARRLVHG